MVRLGVVVKFVGRVFIEEEVGKGVNGVFQELVLPYYF